QLARPVGDLDRGVGYASSRLGRASRGTDRSAVLGDGAQVRDVDVDGGVRHPRVEGALHGTPRRAVAQRADQPTVYHPDRGVGGLVGSAFEDGEAVVDLHQGEPHQSSHRRRGKPAIPDGEEEVEPAQRGGEAGSDHGVLPGDRLGTGGTPSRVRCDVPGPGSCVVVGHWAGIYVVSCGRRTLLPTMFSLKSWAGVEATLSARWAKATRVGKCRVARESR